MGLSVSRFGQDVMPLTTVQAAVLCKCVVVVVSNLLVHSGKQNKTGEIVSKNM